MDGGGGAGLRCHVIGLWVRGLGVEAGDWEVEVEVEREWGVEGYVG